MDHEHPYWELPFKCFHANKEFVQSERRIQYKMTICILFLSCCKASAALWFPAGGHVGPWYPQGHL